ncbi:hypothetical protein CANMA_003415 [Candida margitis]|uniref:uncharacterized protein n=1 Tax=Candida margitis TaxID=1775924 RepID=UPI0022278C3B|nr:uncharacterized protein CANMA_003415 [Candida margitis]KAI5965419.1 hypothetical protein CANMA_003415 [Candida margitis]
MKDDSMIYIDNRAATFEYPVSADAKTYTWSDIIDFPGTSDLVEAGFYYSPHKRTTSRITCVYCQKSTTVKNKSTFEKIISEHAKCSTRCPMVMLSHTFYSCRGSLDDNEIKKCWTKSKFRDPFSQESVKFRAKFFKNFPLDDTDYHPNSTSLSEAGFIYSPRYDGDDRVVCAYCHCALDSWDQQDDPIEEHLSNTSSYCYFLDKYVERKQNVSKRDQRSPFDESLNLDDYDIEDVGVGGDELGDTEPQSCQHPEQDTKQGEAPTRSKHKRHQQTYIKEDPNLKYWKKLPDEDLLQEFIQVSKRSNTEPTDIGNKRGTELAGDTITAIEEQDQGNKDGSVVNDNNVKAGSVLNQDNERKDHGYSNVDSGKPVDDIDDIEQDESDQNDNIVQSSDSIEDSIESSSHDEYDPTSTDSFHPTEDLDESIVEIKPKQTKVKAPKSDKIDRETTPQLEEPRKRVGDSLSPLRRKKIIKRTMPAPVFEDSSTDQDYNEAHIVKLEKNIVKTSTILPLEDKSFEQPEVFTSPVRMSPTKLSESVKKTESIRPSIFDSSCDITNEDAGGADKKAEKNSGKASSKIDKNGETEVVGIKDGREGSIEKSIDKETPIQGAHQDLKSPNKENATTKNELKNSENPFVEAETIQASSTVNNPLTDVEFKKVNDESLKKVDENQDVINVKDGVSTVNDMQKESNEHHSFTERPEVETQKTQPSVEIQSAKQENKLRYQTYFEANPESLQDKDSESDYSDYLNEINEVEKHFEIEDPSEERIVENVAPEHTDPPQQSQENGDVSANKPNANALAQDVSSKEVANQFVSPNKLSIKSAEKRLLQVDQEAKSPVLDESPESIKPPNGDEETRQPSDKDLNSRQSHEKISEHIFESTKLGHPSGATDSPSQQATAKDPNEDKSTVDNVVANSAKVDPTENKETREISQAIEPDDNSDSTGPLAMDSSLDDDNTSAVEETQPPFIHEPKWKAKSMQRFAQQMENLDNSSKELKTLANSKYDLHNDLDGDLTRFIAEMPEEEEQMTIEQWIEHCAANCKDIVAQSIKEMNQYILDEYDRAIMTLESLEKS